MEKLVFEESLCKGKMAFDRIARLQNFIINCKEPDIDITIHSKGRIGLTFVFMLATLGLIAEDNNKLLSLHMDEKMHSLYRRIQVDKNDINGNLMGSGFRRINSSRDIFQLVTQITHQAPVQLDDQVADILVSKIGEMFINAFDHAQAKNIIGGKYFKHAQRFCFSCYDDGIGLTNNVRRFFNDIGQKIPSDVDALRWAMKNGNTTKMLESGISRGIGLSTLQSFVKANDGAMRICSGHALYILNHSGDHYYQIDNEFWGTLFEMDIITDNHHRYILKVNQEA